MNTIPDEPEITDQEESESTDTPDGQENPEQNPAGDQEKPEAESGRCSSPNGQSG